MRSGTDRLPAMELDHGLCLVVADGATARLAGLAGLRSPPERTGLLIPDCRSVHTFGMRFPLALIWLGEEGAIVDVRAHVKPRSVASCRRARAVVEVPPTHAAAFFRAIAAAPAGAIPTRRRAVRAARSARSAPGLR